MPKIKYTYHQLKFFIVVLVWEIVFWIVFSQLISIFQNGQSGSKLVFISEAYVWLLIIIPIIWVLMYLHIWSRNKYVASLPSHTIASTFLNPVSTTRLMIRYLLLRNALVFLILASMQPSLGSRTVKGQSRDVELVFAVDVSRSMDAVDMSAGASRLEAAKKAIIQIINQSSSAKIGILVFAGSVYPHLPLTADIQAAKMFVEDISTDIMANQGTNIGIALARSADYFSDSKLRKIIVLITDGEDHENNLEEGIAQLKDKSAELMIIGVGTENGGLIPLVPGKISVGYLKDEMGQTVQTKLKGQGLRQLATKLDAQLLITADRFPNVNSLLTEINKIGTIELVDLEFEIRENYYRIPLSIGLIFLLILLVFEGFSVSKRKV